LTRQEEGVNAEGGANLWLAMQKIVIARSDSGEPNRPRSRGTKCPGCCPFNVPRNGGRRECRCSIAPAASR